MRRDLARPRRPTQAGTRRGGDKDYAKGTLHLFARGGQRSLTLATVFKMEEETVPHFSRSEAFVWSINGLDHRDSR